jgi:hypothetical protein
MPEDLNRIRLELKGLGFSPPQIDSIVDASLVSRRWSDLSADEQTAVMNSLKTRIHFYKRFMRSLCNCCHTATTRLPPAGVGGA